jgi:hypothetical protein
MTLKPSLFRPQGKTDAGAIDPNLSFEPYFIVGAPRSGTTLLTVLLDRHDEIVMTPETKIFPDMPGHWWRGRALTHEQVMASFRHRTHLFDLRLQPKEVLERFRLFPPTYRDFVRSVLECYRARAGKAFVGEKTPEHIWEVLTILEWYPRAKIIWLLRDGRDVAPSIDRFNRCGLRRACMIWWQAAKYGLRWERRFPEQFRRVRFESLVTRPEETLRKVCAFLGPEYQPKMLDASVPSAIVPPHEMGHKRSSLAAIEPSKAGEYLRMTNPEERRLMSAMLEPMLLRLGYAPTEFGSSSAPARLKDSLARLPWLTAYHPVVRNLVNRTGCGMYVSALWGRLIGQKEKRGT